jgi:hypothetical protein
MPLLRLAYVTQFLIAVIAVFVLWSQVGGQSHLDLLPWHVKLGLACAAAYCIVRSTAAAVGGARGWNAQSVAWLGLALAALVACGLASYYAHLYLEESDQEDQQQDAPVSRLVRPNRPHPLNL